MILDIHNLADVIQDFKAVDEFTSCLGEIKARNYVCQKLVFHTEVALEVLIEELEKLILKGLCCSAFCKREVLIVGK